VDTEQPRHGAARAHQSEAAQAPSLRQLWSDQVFFTRRYIIAALGGSPVSELLVKALGGAVPPIATAPGVRDLVPHFGPGDAAAIQLLTNVEAMGEAVVPYFGKEAGSALTTLLREHVLIAVGLLAAARSGDISSFKSEDERWTANADQIADLLAKANEFWSREDIARRLHLLLQLTKDEAVARVANSYDVDLKTFDRIYAEAIAIADALTEGLIRKFPHKLPAGPGGRTHE
jgi:hypothetical protein